MYDFAHPLSDAIEGITHSLCTLEFETTGRSTTGSSTTLAISTATAPQQIEFARLNLTYTVMSKRKLLQLVEQKLRLRLGRSAHADASPGCAAAATRRRRSATSASASASPRSDNVVDVALLEHCVREDLNQRAPRVMAVLRPLKVVIENYPEGQVEELDAINNPEDASGRHAQGAVLARALHRAGRLRGGPAEEVLPPRARPRGAAALRLLHHAARRS